MLWSNVQFYLGHAWAESTKRTYQTQMKCYFEFCQTFRWSPAPLTHENIMVYMVYLADVKHFKYHTIKCYVNIVSVIHKASNYPDPTKNSWDVTQLWRGLKRQLGSSQDCVQPVTPTLLLGIRQQLNLFDLTDLVFWSACLVAFFGLLRPGNFLVKTHFDPDKHLRRLDALPCSWGYLLQLRWTKTIQFRERNLYVTLPTLPGHPLCPATPLKTLFELTTDHSLLEPLFSVKRSSPLMYASFTTKFRSLIAATGLDPSKYSGHSFRRGGASWARQIGCSDEEIQTLGDWRSDAFKRYYDDDISRRINITSRFGHLLPATIT